MATATTLAFVTAAREIAAEAHRLGLAPPGFRSPPRRAGARRSIRRWPKGGAMVAVAVKGREFDDVVADMVDGVLVANGLTGQQAEQTRARLLAVVTGANEAA